MALDGCHRCCYSGDKRDSLLLLTAKHTSHGASRNATCRPRIHLSCSLNPRRATLCSAAGRARSDLRRPRARFSRHCRGIDVCVRCAYHWLHNLSSWSAAVGIINFGRIGSWRSRRGRILIEARRRGIPRARAGSGRGARLRMVASSNGHSHARKSSWTLRNRVEGGIVATVIWWILLSARNLRRSRRPWRTLRQSASSPPRQRCCRVRLRVVDFSRFNVCQLQGAAVEVQECSGSSRPL